MLTGLGGQPTPCRALVVGCPGWTEPSTVTSLSGVVRAPGVSLKSK